MSAKKNIFIIDDNLHNVQVLAQFLSNEGFNISIATKSENVLKACALKHYDLILLDIMMAHLDGFELCQHIKASQNKDIPIIFLSARTDDATIRKCFEVGGCEFVSKPFKQNDLLHKISKHLKG